MKRRNFFIFFIFLLFSLQLSSCAKMRSVYSTPSPYDQCVAIQRNQLFLNASLKNQERSRLQGQQIELRREFDNLKCDDVIAQHKAEKDKSKSQKKQKTTK
jgi:hypothetical protein